jgi:hypothetical protein
MNWFYVRNGHQVGPVTEAQLAELLRSGEINHDTSVWREGMADWQPLSLVYPGSLPSLTALPSGKVCVECGKTFPADELVELNRSWVCAQCKPVFLQRLAEGATLPSHGNLWRVGKRLVTCSETAFPDRCVKCNAPANGFRLKRVLYWQHPAYYLLLLCNILVLAIVVLIVRKKAILHVGLCEKHIIRRQRGLIIGWSSFAIGVMLVIAAAWLGSGWAALIGIAILLGGGITGAVMATTVSAAKITKENVWVTGIHRDFLAQLPEWHGP